MLQCQCHCQHCVSQSNSQSITADPVLMFYLYRQSVWYLHHCQHHYIRIIAVLLAIIITGIIALFPALSETKAAVSCEAHIWFLYVNYVEYQYDIFIIVSTMGSVLWHCCQCHSIKIIVSITWHRTDCQSVSSYLISMFDLYRLGMMAIVHSTMALEIEHHCQN